MGEEIDREMLDWQGEDCYLSEEMNLGKNQCLWNEVRQNEEDVSCYMFDETTVKACGEVMKRNDLIFQVKRHRMLYFQNEDMPSVFLKTKDREDSYEEALSDMSQWVSSFSDSSGYTDLDQSSERWVADCFTNSEMNYSPIDESLPEASDDQIYSSDFCYSPPDHQATTSQKGPTPRRRSIVLKGSKSFVPTQTNIATSVAYPFDIIKPCSYRGDTTLKEINQRLCKPSPSSHKHKIEDPFSASYPTLPFSGKPVVGKTTIHTEGGRGRITIMKTRG